MVEEEITLNELLNRFKVKINLPEKLLKLEISSDFLKADYTNEDNLYKFNSDDVWIIINPKDKKETIQYLLIIDNKIHGGYILGYDSMTYLN